MINLKRLSKSFTYAFRGLCKTFREEQNLKIQTLLGTAALILAAVFRIGRLEWVFLILAISGVILMEMANSAVERITDVLKPRINSYVKEIKDIMAAAVMIASIAALVIGLLIFYPYLVR